MQYLHVTRATKTGDTHEHITYLGTEAQTFTVDDVISLIESGEWNFYTSVAAKVSVVVVREGADGTYLQSNADGFWQNNLLSLPPCKFVVAQ